MTCGRTTASRRAEQDDATTRKVNTETRSPCGRLNEDDVARAPYGLR
jgi:hypothetical protein